MQMELEMIERMRKEEMERQERLRREEMHHEVRLMTVIAGLFQQTAKTVSSQASSPSSPEEKFQKHSEYLHFLSEFPYPTEAGNRTDVAHVLNDQERVLPTEVENFVFCSHYEIPDAEKLIEIDLKNFSFAG